MQTPNSFWLVLGERQEPEFVILYSFDIFSSNFFVQIDT